MIYIYNILVSLMHCLHICGFEDISSNIERYESKDSVETIFPEEVNSISNMLAKELREKTCVLERQNNRENPKFKMLSKSKIFPDLLDASSIIEDFAYPEGQDVINIFEQAKITLKLTSNALYKKAKPKLIAIYNLINEYDITQKITNITLTKIKNNIEFLAELDNKSIGYLVFAQFSSKEWYLCIALDDDLYKYSADYYSLIKILKINEKYKNYVSTEQLRICIYDLIYLDMSMENNNNNILLEYNTNNINIINNIDIFYRINHLNVNNRSRTIL